MLVVASFFAGRMSLIPEIRQAHQIADQARVAELRALEAEKYATYLANVAQAQAVMAANESASQKSAGSQEWYEKASELEEADSAPQDQPQPPTPSPP
jgi:hypothetical protein